MEFRSRPLTTTTALSASWYMDKKLISNGKWANFADVKNNRQISEFHGSQSTESENHEWPPRKGNTRDVGGPFWTTKISLLQPISSVSYSWDEPSSTIGTLYNRWRGHYNVEVACPVETNIDWKPFSRTSDNVLASYGSQAVSRSSPTNSGVDLATALGEVRKDGLPHLVSSRTWEGRTRRAKQAGDNYLNVVFGWSPLVNDITNFGHTVIHSNDILKQYSVDKGEDRGVRRRYEFPEVVTHTEAVLSTNKSPLGNLAAIPQFSPGAHTNGKWTKSTVTSTKRWYSGKLSYGVPNVLYHNSGIQEFAAKADKLFGISLTPDVVWNLSPWSWAIDWFTNTGDVLTNVSDYVSQGLIQRYGYIMEEKSTTITYSLDGVTISGKPVPVPPAVINITSKQRGVANPYGFGVSWNGLSTTQAAILAALGITRT